jgi:hypothetical protein
MLDNMNVVNSCRDFLQQPTYPYQGVTASFFQLLAALDQGWEVTAPVKMMPTNNSFLWNYHFILVNRDKCRFCQIVVPALDEFVGFINDNEYQVEKYEG